MTQQRRKTKIKDCEYSIALLDGVSAFEGLGVLAKHVGGPLGFLLAAKSDAEADPMLLARALQELGRAIGEPDMRDLLYRMLEGSTVQARGVPQPQPLVVGGSLEIFKGHFTGKVGEIAQLAWFALRENFANFSEALPGVVSLVQRATGQDPGPSTSQKDKTGESRG